MEEARTRMNVITVAAGIIVEGGKVLLTQRKEDSAYGLLWEFPGGKVKEGEEPRGALRRELKEEIDLDASVGRLYEVVYHLYPEYPVLLLFYCCRIEKGTPKPLECRDLRWVPFDELERLPMLPADVSIQERLRTHLKHRTEAQRDTGIME